MEELMKKLEDCKTYVLEILSGRQLADYYSPTRVEVAFYELLQFITNPYKMASVIADELINN